MSRSYSRSSHERYESSRDYRRERNSKKSHRRKESHRSSTDNRSEAHSSRSHHRSSRDAESKHTAFEKAHNSDKSPKSSILTPSKIVDNTSSAPNDLSKSPDYVNLAKSPKSELQQLGELSEKLLREKKTVKLPDANDYLVEAQKERYYRNMYKLIVTARREIQKLENEIQTLNTKLKSNSVVSCPSCSHKFGVNKARYLPKYLKVLHSTHRMELQFNDAKHMRKWLTLTNLDTDASDVPTYFEKENAVNKELKLADVNSILCDKTSSLDSKQLS